VRVFDGTKSEFRTFTTALLLHCGTAVWILEVAPSHFATLSTSKQAEVTESQEDFLTAYARIGSTAAYHRIAGLLTIIFKPYAHTAHVVRAEVVYGLGNRAATDIWQSIRATYADVSDFVCNMTMELFHLLHQFDGSHYKTLESDINLLLEQISAEKLSIRDLTAMCLVMGIKYAGQDNPAWREDHLAIIKFLTSSWDKIDGKPDRLLTVFRKAQIAVDIMGSDPDFKPTRRSHIHGVLATHLTVKDIQTKGCIGGPLYYSTLRNGSYYWRNAPFSEGNRAHKPGNRVDLAVNGAHDDSDTPDTVIVVINRALNDDHLDPDLRREIPVAVKIYDFARLEGLSDRCDQDVDNRAFHMFLSSRVSDPGDSPFLTDNPEMQRRARDFAGPHA